VQTILTSVVPAASYSETDETRADAFVNGMS